jgi:Arc/MetJ family transcription regulator
MRVVIDIGDDLLAQAREYTGELNETALVRMALEALVEREAARRLATLSLSIPGLELPCRPRL